MANRHTLEELKYLQAMPLDLKVRMTKQRVREWIREYGETNVHISFSGGKDSTVLLDIVRQDYPNVKAVFVDVPTQYPELKEFVKTFPNVEILKPKISFMQVCEKYGFPLISKEVSECVEGARKYLRSIAENGGGGGTPTDSINSADKASLVGGGTTQVGGDEQGASASIPMGVREDHGYREILKALKTIQARGGSGVATQDTSPNSLAESESRGNFYSKIIDSSRLQILTGIYTNNGKATMENIPNEKDRSRYSCERYQFFLEAPFEISNKCCGVMKKQPIHQYEKRTGSVGITAQMAEESNLRTQVWLKNSCNAFDAKHPISNPMSFWTEQDVLQYIYEHKLPICSVYGDVVKDTEVLGQMDISDFGGDYKPKYRTTGCKRTGCMLCGFGCHLEKAEDSRFLRLKETHPKMYALLDVVKNNGVTMREAMEWCNEHGNLKIKF